ncbi:MAG TPA: D-2-hydroxyacid dehydrogenase [Candidatus Cottocaccamicrobium excrementipullorum]|nr:D-2-hydroxyacid dehydrogenase [Candidatus Cottocaccamicrobium excrementipullorum]
MEIVVLDGYTENPGDLSWEGFEKLGELKVYDRTPMDKVIERIGNAEAVIVNKAPITKEIISACPSIRYIGVLATGYNVIDVNAAKENGIVVTNIPSYGTWAVGQFAIALLLEICHHVAHHDQAVHEGRWSTNPDWCFWDYPLIELAGKTMGIIGFGRIGQVTGKIAKAMGMHILAYDKHQTEEGKEIAEYTDLDNLLSRADVISLHCPLFPDTEGLINRETISKMKDGVIILNNSRGPLIVEEDLAEALSSGKVYGAGLDVVKTEPILPDNPLLKAPNCLITPHISWAPKESRSRLMDIAVNNLKAFIEGRLVNVVNN